MHAKGTNRLERSTLADESPASEDLTLSPERQSMTVSVLNEQGLHARPAAILAREAQRFPCDVRIAQNGDDVDAKSILDILTLAAGYGANLDIVATGPQADEAVAHLARLFQKRFR
ncbi:HPr family phosphocarrier protein [Desulfovibrio sulfodismutans]|uniref:HPr family phosphocarrier protein n=1 Tax=Desulfolutivibrio sulfodismutans TaxID=63561 RepID=A0A7K3NNJ8_9BACT|nr:HPr family phosphocarrier protein [Desulfolutivibrio sulfodismutans]QLA13344.1 HPr family phosphocarrier protein [Desulfolutivibrio sulfodismutans DSM 3696]